MMNKEKQTMLVTSSMFIFEWKQKERRDHACADQVNSSSKKRALCTRKNCDSFAGISSSARLSPSFPQFSRANPTALAIVTSDNVNRTFLVRDAYHATFIASYRNIEFLSSECFRHAQRESRFSFYHHGKK